MYHGNKRLTIHLYTNFINRFPLVNLKCVNVEKSCIPTLYSIIFNIHPIHTNILVIFSKDNPHNYKNYKYNNMFSIFMIYSD